LDDAKAQMVDIQYHDIKRDRGVFYNLQQQGLVDSICSQSDIENAKIQPPQTTRAKLRGDFIRQAKLSKRDFTVDWVHLKLNDETPKTVVCKDPFQSVDDRVQRLIDTL
jgi:proteasome accessory factor A